MSKNVSGQNEHNNDLSMPRYSWHAPGGAFITMPFSLAERMKQEVMDAFCALPKRGLEVGGVLLGRVARRDPLEVTVDHFEPLPCEHRFGPSLILSDTDRVQLEQILGRMQAERSIVGYFRSFTGREIELDETDQELMTRHFSDPGQVILAIEPVSFTECFAWCFARRNARALAKPAGPRRPFADRPSSKDWQELEPPAESALKPVSEIVGPAEQVPEPTPAPPAPLPAVLSDSPWRSSEPETPRRGIWPWMLVALASLAGFAWIYPWSQAPSSQQPLHVGLAAQRTASGIELTWDRSAAAQRQVTGGLLSIQDAGSERQIELDAGAVARGRMTYTPSGSDLLFRLSLFGPGKQSATESFAMTGALPCPLPAPGRGETVAAARVDPEVASQPDSPLRAKPETSPAIAQPVPRRAAPEAAIAAVPIHEVQPGLSEGIQARLRSPVTVPISVKIDAAGKVTSATAPGTGDGLYNYLAERAQQAARFWRFQPARANNGQPVSSTKTLFFVFRGDVRHESSQIRR